MVKVLLVVEDYGELVYFQTLLKKIGFDAEGAGSKHTVQEVILGFKPQVVIVSARGRKMDAPKIIEEIHSKQLGCKFIYIQTAPKMAINRLVSSKVIQRVLEAPVSVFDLVGAVSELAGLNPKELEEKLHKLAQSGDFESDEELVHITSGLGSVVEPEREPSLRPLPYDGSDDRSLFSDLDGEKMDLSKPFSTPKTDMPDAARQRRFAECLKNSTGTSEHQFLPGDRVRKFNREIRAKDDIFKSGEFIEQHRKFITALLKR